MNTADMLKGALGLHNRCLQLRLLEVLGHLLGALALVLDSHAGGGARGRRNGGCDWRCRCRLGRRGSLLQQR